MGLAFLELTGSYIAKFLNFYTVNLVWWSLWGKNYFIETLLNKEEKKI